MQPLSVAPHAGLKAHELTLSQRQRINADDRQPDLFADELREAQFADPARTGNKTARYEVGKAVIRRRTKAPDPYAQQVRHLAKILRY